MELDSEEELEVIREKVLYLDFNNKLPNDLLKNEIFVRLANLKDDHPLVQVNDMIFEGSYDYCVGTNMFFEKLPEPPSEEDFPFPEKVPFQYKLTECTPKILNLKEMKIPTCVEQLSIAKSINVQYNWNFDYKELLRQFESGTLDINDLVKKSDQKEETVVQDKAADEEEEEELIATNDKHNNKRGPARYRNENLHISDLTKVNISEHELPSDLKSEYEKLELLARTPVCRDIPFEEAPCDPNFQKEYEYKNIECKILKPPLFSYLRHAKNPNFEDHVDLDRCVNSLLISPSNTHPRTLTEEEKIKIMTMENFENLDLTARYSVLVMHLEELELHISENTPEQNSTKDEFGRTPVETLEVFRRLTAALEKRINEINLC